MMTSRQIFSENEKTCLQELILKYNLHKTSTMTASQNTKKVLWIHLTEEFNSIESNAKRSEAQLKKCWDNLKTRQKSILTHEKRQRMKTGGGRCVPNVPQPGSSNEALIAEVLTDQTDVELRGVIDSDTIYSSEDIAMELETSVQAAAEPQQNDEVPSASRARSSVEEYQSVSTPIHLMGSRLTVCAGATSQGNVANTTPIHGTPSCRDTPPRRDTSPCRETSPRRSESRLTDYGAAPLGGGNVRNKVIQEEFMLRKESYEKKARREDELFQLQKKEREWMVMAAEQIYQKAKAEREAAEELLKYNRAKREQSEK